MEYSDKIYVAGHGGMVGSAICRRLQTLGFHNLVTLSSKQLDLTNQQRVADFFADEKPDLVFLAAARVGGIMANNTFRAQFIYDNLMIQNNVIHQSYMHGVKKLMFLGSSCIYPTDAAQPLKEEYLLSGYLEQTNEPYAIAKIAGIKMCDAYRSQYGCNFISVMPTNLYGSNDNFDLNNSHVLPALIRKFHEAKAKNLPEVIVWGSGNPRREFLHADDLADACIFLMDHYNSNGLVNIGTGADLAISELATIVKNIVGFEGEIVYDRSKPDGTFRKLMDVSKLHGMGWQHSIELMDGIHMAYENFKNEQYRLPAKNLFC